MRIIAKRTLREFWDVHNDSEDALRAWYQEAKQAEWGAPHEIKAMYGNASIVGDNRVVFNICGNKYRLIVKFNYVFKIGLVRFIGTHADYHKINAETI